jgi:hypothetical protein
MDPKQILDALAAPFEAADVKWKPQTVKNNRALAVLYVDARAVQDRLDEVLGVENWQDEYAVQSDGSVVCKLSVRIGGEWVAKMDVGSPSEQPDSGDRLKAAFSDALKRAAVKFGVGRYIYRVESQWVDYDPVKKQFARVPTLPRNALPGPVVHEARSLPPARPQLSGTVDNPGARTAAVESYQTCPDMAEFKAVGQRVKGLKAAGKLSDADLAAIREAAGHAQDRLAGAKA